jgi:hypothetical protein
MTGKTAVVRRVAGAGLALLLVYFFCAPGGLENFFRDIASGLPPSRPRPAPA